MKAPAPDHAVLAAFQEALDAPPEQRDQALDRLARRDHALAAEVRKLLDADAQNADGFMESPPLGRELTAQTLAAPLVACAQPEQAARGVDPAAFRLGRYRGLAVLGLSRHAIVLLAEQTGPVRRLVAVKILREGDAASETWARFERERQAVASLSHENIARLYDAGADDDGSPYFVMEYVPGRPITDFAAERSLSLPERLALLVQVCRAVEHAHEHGLLHRDLKPGNILAAGSPDEPPVAKVIDFGVVGARSGQSWAALTQSGCAVGTPLYMSPEQLCGQAADERSDVYALGVVLYEVLAGRSPVSPTGEGLSETLRRTRYGFLLEEDALAAMPGDLRWVITRATSPVPASRYQSARDLREDLERYLDGRDVSAHPPTTIQRVRRIVLRRSRRAAAALLLAVAVVAGVAAAARGLRAVEAERSQFHRELAAVLVQQPDAILSDLPGAHRARRAQLDHLEAIAASLSRRERNDPEILAATAEILTAQASLDEEEHLLEQAAERLDRALAIRSRLVHARPRDAEAARLHSLAIVRVGDMTKHLGDVPGGVRLYAQALGIDKRLVAEHPENQRLRLTLAWSFERIAYADRAEGEHEKAERGHLAQLAAIESIEGSEAERCRCAANVHLSIIALETGDARAARARAAAAVEHAQAAVHHNSISRSARIALSTAVIHSAGTEELLGDDRAALDIYERALDLDLLSLNVPDPILLRDAGGLCHRAARTARKLGDDAREERFFTVAEEIAEQHRSLIPNDIDVLHCLAASRLGLAAIARRRSEIERAAALTRQAIQVLRDALELAPHNPECVVALAEALVTAEPQSLRDPREARRLVSRLPDLASLTPGVSAARDLVLRQLRRLGE